MWRDEPYSTEDQLQVRVLWFGICVFLTPVALVLSRNANPPGCASRSFFQNAHSLFGLSIMMFNAWAFKDVAVQVAVWHKPPDNCYQKLSKDCTWNGSVGYRWGYTGYVFGIAVAAVLFGFLYESWL